MRAKMVILLVVSMLSVGLAGCSNGWVLTLLESSIHAVNPPDRTVEDEEDIIPRNTSEPFVGRMDLDAATEKLFYGTWRVEKLLGFANSYNDASEYPSGQDVIGDEIIIHKDFFSSKGLERYNVYQYELENPGYQIGTITYNGDSFYRIFKMDLPGLGKDDEVRAILVSEPSTEFSIPMGFLDFNHDRLLLVLEAAVFELKRVAE